MIWHAPLRLPGRGSHCPVRPLWAEGRYVHQFPRKQRQTGLRPQSLPPCPKPVSETQWRHPGFVKPRLLPEGPANTQFSSRLLPGFCGCVQHPPMVGRAGQFPGNPCHRSRPLQPHVRNPFGPNSLSTCLYGRQIPPSLRPPSSCLPVACERDLRPQTTCPQNWRAAQQAWQRSC